MMRRHGVFTRVLQLGWTLVTGIQLMITQVRNTDCCIAYRYYSWRHHDYVIMSLIVTQITSLTIVYSTVYSDADQRKHQSSASLAFVWGIHRGPVNSPQKWPVTRKMFPFDDVILEYHSPHSGFSQLRADTSVSEWAPMSIEKRIR